MLFKAHIVTRLIVESARRFKPQLLTR